MLSWLLACTAPEPRPPAPPERPALVAAPPTAERTLRYSPLLDLRPAHEADGTLVLGSGPPVAWSFWSVGPAPEVDWIRQGLSDASGALTAWATQQGLPRVTCRPGEPLSVVVLEHAVLNDPERFPIVQQQGGHILGLFDPEGPTVLLSSGAAHSWRQTLAHELAHLAHHRFCWRASTDADSETLARRFEADVARWWEDVPPVAGLTFSTPLPDDLPRCRGLFQRRRRSRGRCR